MSMENIHNMQKCSIVSHYNLDHGSPTPGPYQFSSVVRFTELKTLVYVCACIM